MDDNNELVQLALKELPDSPTKKPWMTAASLAKRIHANHHNPVHEEYLEKALELESTSKNRRVRYSVYPSAHSLQILWGAVSAVGDRRLPGLVLTEGDEQKETSDVSINDDHIVFISHNYRDKEHVLRLCDEFEKASIPTWIFETRIQEGETIIHEVRRAIDQAPVCVLFLSKNSISSTWVRKEVLNVRGGVRLVVNASDVDLCNYISQLNTRPANIPESILSHCKTDLQKDNGRKLLEYIYECFIETECPVYFYDETVEFAGVKKLIAEIHHLHHASG